MARLPAFLQDRRGRDYSLLELAVAGAILFGVLAVFLDQMRYYQEQAERSAVRSTIARMQSALALRASAELLRGAPERIEALGRENPVDWLAVPPANYAGAYYGEPPERLSGGGWYFDRASGALVYQVWRTGHIEVADREKPDIRFRVAVEYARDGQGPRELKRLEIAPLTDVRWFDERLLAAGP